MIAAKIELDNFHNNCSLHTTKLVGLSFELFFEHLPFKLNPDPTN